MVTDAMWKMFSSSPNNGSNRKDIRVAILMLPVISVTSGPKPSTAKTCPKESERVVACQEVSLCEDCKEMRAELELLGGLVFWVGFRGFDKSAGLGNIRAT